MEETIEKPKVIIPASDIPGAKPVTTKGLNPEQLSGVLAAKQSLAPIQEPEIQPQNTPAFTVNPDNAIDSNQLDLTKSDVQRERSTLEQQRLDTQNTAQQESDTYLQGIKDSFAQLGGRSQAIADEEAKFDITGQTTKLTQANTQLTQLTNTFDEAIRSLEVNAEGATQEALSRRERNLITEKAIAVGAQASIVQTMQGNIEYAQKIAKDTVDLKYADVEQELKQQMFLLERADTELSDADAAVLQDEKNAIAAQQAEIKAQKDEDNLINTVMLEVSKTAEATPELLQSIANSGSYQEAIFLSGGALGEDSRIKIAQQQFTNKIALANLSLSEASQNQSWDIFLREMAFDREKFNDTVNARTDAQFKKDAETASTSDEAKQAVKDDKVSATDKTLGLKAKMNEILNHPGLKGSVGPNPLYRSDFGTSFISGNKQDFEAKFTSFIATLTIENLDLMSGILTDNDIKILKDAATSLTTDVTEKAFKENMAGLIKIADRAITDSGVTLEQIQFYNLIEHEDDARELAAMNNIPINQSVLPESNESYY